MRQKVLIQENNLVRMRHPRRLPDRLPLLLFSNIFYLYHSILLLASYVSCATLIQPSGEFLDFFTSCNGVVVTHLLPQRSSAECAEAGDKALTIVIVLAEKLQSHRECKVEKKL